MARPRVLCVDDDLNHLQIRVELLRQIGCDAIPAHDRRSALRSARRIDIDLCITDYHLKNGETGQDVARDIRAVRPRAALILFTGDPEIAASERASFDAVLIKGQGDISLLLEVVDQFCAGALHGRQNRWSAKTVRNLLRWARGAVTTGEQPRRDEPQHQRLQEVFPANETRSFWKAASRWLESRRGSYLAKFG
jgi:CheY-like chemotaxis protein